MMTIKRLLLSIIALLFLLAPAFAEERAVVGEVVAGEQGYEIAVEVENWKNEPLKNVVVKVTEPPVGLINFEVTPPSLESLAAKEITTFIIHFDVAEDAVAKDSVELGLTVSAEDTEFDQPNPKLSVAIVESAGKGKEVPGSDDPRILKLVDIQWETPPTAAEKSGVVSRSKNEAGFSVAYEKKSAATAENYGIGFTKYPLEIVTGEPFEVSFEGFLGQSTRYRCTTPGWENNKPYVRAKFIARGDHDIAVHEIFSASNEVLICPANSVELSVEDQHQSLIQVKAVFTPMEGEQRKNERVESTHYTYTTAIVGEGEAWDSGGKRRILIYWRDDPKKENKGTKPEKKSGSLTLTLQGFDPADGVVRLIYRSVAEGESAIQNVTAYVRPEVPPLMVDPDVQAAPKEEYGIYLLKQGNALWVGPASELTGKAAGDFTYGGLCRDPKQCPVEPTRLKGPFATQEQANTAFCADYKGGRYVLGVNWVYMSYGNFGAASVPRCSGDPRPPVTPVETARAGSGHRDEATVPEPTGTDRTDAAGLSGSDTPPDAAPGQSPTDKAALSPDNPAVKRLIKEWLGNAEPLANAQGADLRFDQWGRVHGRAAGGVITLHGSPDDAAGRTPEQYVWGQRDTLDSLNSCNLGEFVELSLSGGSTAICRERHNTERQVNTELPALAGKTYQEAVAAIEAAGLVALPPELGSNTSDPALIGRVELAVPAVDGQLRRGDKVGLRLFGKAVIGVPVPNVVGRGVRDAVRAIEKAGFVADFELGAETTDPQKAQTVASQTPMPGVEIEAGKTVKMLVLTLKERTIAVPDLRNSAISKVDQLLRQAGLKMVAQLGDLAPKSRQESGQVYRQSPEPGLEVKAGAVVEVWVYGAYVDAVPPVKETAPPEETATEFCSLGKANFPYQPDREYFVFRGREPQKITSRKYIRKYNFLADNARNAQAVVRQIQQEGKMELVFTGKLPGLCPHLRENCAYSTLNHADGSFFGDICGKWADPARSSISQRPAPIPDLTVVKAPNLNGMQIAEAQRVLRESGLKMSATLAGAAPNRSAVGKVAKQKPEPGQEISDGDEVQVWVYGKYEEKKPTAKAVVPPAANTREYCSLGKSGFIYQPDIDYFVFRSREPRKITSSVYDRGYQILGGHAKDAARQITQENKMELVSDGPLKDLCPHLRTHCALSSMNHADGSFFGDLCGKWDDPVPSSASKGSTEGQANKDQTSHATAPLHVCKDPAVKTDSYALKYARGYGGGETTYFIRQNHFCHKQGYSKIVGNKVDYYECRDTDFKDCSLKSSTSAERKELGDGVYQLFFDGGKSWWTIRPRQ